MRRRAATTKPKRAGRTTTFSVSVDEETKEQLKAAADRWHDGNMSRLFRAVARRLEEDAAFERAWRWYGGAPPTPEETAEIDRWIDRLVPKPRRRTKAA